jgi:hypothetical protein
VSLLRNLSQHIGDRLRDSRRQLDFVKDVAVALEEAIFCRLRPRTW